MNEDCRVFREFTGEILVDGMNVYNPDVVQFRIYVDPHLGDSSLFIFPITSGLQFFGFYNILNIKDCIGIFTLSDIEEMCKDTYKKNK